MLKTDKTTLEQFERADPGVFEAIHVFESAALPSCLHCGSCDTAAVHCGAVRRTINISAATTKFKLIANGPKPGIYFCNKCNGFFS